MAPRSPLKPFTIFLVMLLLMPYAPTLSVQSTGTPDADDRSIPIPHLIGKPEGDGPYKVGYTYEYLSTTTKTYKVMAKIFYPAIQAGENVTKNSTGAPYPTVVWLPGTCCGPEEYTDLLNNMATWGIVVMTVGLNWSDVPYSGNVSDMEEFLDYLEGINTTLGSPLFGMIDKDAFGLTGHSGGGGIGIIDAAYVDRIKAVHVLAPAISNGSIDYVSSKWHKPFMCQVSQNDDYYINGCRHAFDEFQVLNSKVELLGGDHLGPYVKHLIVAFFLLHLDDEMDYWTYLYGEDAVTDSMASNYDVWFRVPNGTFFPPNLTIESIGGGELTWSATIDFEVYATGMIEGMYLPGHPDGSFAWDFDGDGIDDYKNDTKINTTYIYREIGCVTPFLKYKLGRFVFATSDGSICVSNQLPRARAGVDGIIDEDAEYLFNASESWDSVSDIDTLQYKWDFGDGNVQDFVSKDVGMIVSHIYNDSGIYYVKLWVMDRHGDVSQDWVKVTVSNLAPMIIDGLDKTVKEDEKVWFSAFGIDTSSDMRELLYQWNFGDGSNSTEWSLDPSVNYTYPRNGTYIATVTVKDHHSAFGTDSANVTVLDMIPELEIISPGSGSKFDEDEPVRFIGKAWDTPTDQRGLRYQWDFGDGTSSEISLEPNATHTYTDVGPFTVKFNVMDGDNTNSTTRNITVVNVAPSIVMIDPEDPQFVVEDDAVVFKGKPTDTRSDEDQLSCKWVIEGKPYNGTTVTHKFPNAGTYEARFVVWDAHGAIAKKAVSVTVFNRPPTVDANVAPVTIVTGDVVHYSVTVEDTPSDLETIQLFWDFGDGTNSTTAKGSHVYSEPGSYVLKVTVTDDNNETDWLSYAITVMKPSVPPPPPTEEEEGMDPMALEVGLLALMIVAVILMASAFIGKDAPPATPRRRKKGRTGKKGPSKGKRTKKRKA